MPNMGMSRPPGTPEAKLTMEKAIFISNRSARAARGRALLSSAVVEMPTPTSTWG